MAAGVDVPDDIDNVQITFLDLTLDVAAGIPYLQKKLEDKEITVNVTNRSASLRRVMRLQRRTSP